MDQNLAFVMNEKVKRTIKNLNANNMKGYFVQDEKEACEKIKELIQEGDTVSVGGSMTLDEIGALDLLRDEKYNFLDRYEADLTAEQIKELYRKSFFADVYLTSSNAITEEGELYNVDGTGNRVAAMIYGPDKVIVVAGINKIVNNLEDAISRVENLAAPANTKRLDRGTPCTKTGYCMDCHNPKRICNDYVLIRKQVNPDRIHIIIVNKELGY